MILTKEATMNLHYRGNPIVMDALQGDSGRALVIHFLAGETPWTIPENTHILVQYCCQDGTGGIYDSLPDDTSAYVIDGDTLTVFLASAVCAVAGETKLQVTLLNDGVQLSSFPVVIQVTPQVNAQAESGEYTNLMQWWVKRDIKGEKGDSGVYVGTGEMPAGYNVQVDPTGDESIWTQEEVQEIADCAANLLRGEIDNKLSKSPDDWEAWTDEEQAAARDRMGLENTCELIEIWTNDTEEPVNFVRTQTPDGTPYAYKHMLIRMLGETKQDAYKLLRCYVDDYSSENEMHVYAVPEKNWDTYISVEDGFVVMKNNFIYKEGNAPHIHAAFSDYGLKRVVTIQPKACKKIVKIEFHGIPAGSTLYIWGTK